MLTVESRIGRLGRTSFTLEHRLTAGESAAGHARLVATAEGVQVLYDYAEGRPREMPPDVVARLEAFEGRPSADPRQPSTANRRKIVTAFWPPKPKPLTATVSTFVSRATSGT